MVHSEFQPREVRYIKRGRANSWADYAIQNDVLPIGYGEIDHKLCLDGRWDEVRNLLFKGGRNAQGASQGTREIRDFYELGPERFGSRSPKVTFTGHSRRSLSKPLALTVTSLPRFADAPGAIRI